MMQPPSDTVPSDAVLRKGPVSAQLPQIVIPGDNLGLGIPGDELDGMSYNRSTVLRTTEFVLLFSVGRDTTGDVPQDPVLVAGNLPFNVADQAARGHADGDGYISLFAINTNGPIDLFLRTSNPGNVEAVAHFDEGGQDYQAQPPVGSKQPSTADTDNTNSTAYDDPDPERSADRASNRTVVHGLYFTVSRNSPSLDGSLPGTSGADIFFDPRPDLPGLQRQFPYATAQMLGLSPFDDISAMIVDDFNTNGWYDPGDRVYFSLARFSPTLLNLAFASSNGAADVYVSEYDAAGSPVIQPFVFAEQLGLVGRQDDIDALEIVPCGTPSSPCDALQFARDSGIRLFKGDWTNDGVIGISDAQVVPFCMSGPWQGPGFLPPPIPCGDIFDFNGDSDVDLEDFAALTQVFGTAPGD
ncbi:MAG: hypothetical protein H6817_09320 [Phycisphaerales bacterium]|nr:hypothetical protein [Phycisphaerales bacterium]